MRTKFVTHLPGFIGALAALMCAGAVFAQEADYPSRNISALLGYAAGGGADVSTRYFAEKLSQRAGQPVIVVNRPGAQAMLAAGDAARAKPDGYTLLFAAGNALAAGPSMFKQLNFDPLTSFSFVTTLFRTPYVMVASPKVAAASVAELTAYLKAKKEKPGFFGYQGLINQAAGELYNILAGVNATSVAYKDVQQLLPDLVSGAIDFAFLDSTFALEQAKDGRLRALAVTIPERTPLAPDLPGMKEAGIDGFDLSAWFAVYLPAGAPAPVGAKLSGWLNDILASDETKQFLLRTGTQPLPGSPDRLAAYQRAQGARWAELIKAAKIEPQ